MILGWSLGPLLWAVGVWAATTAVTLVIVAGVVATLPVTYFCDATAAEPVGGTPTWRVARRIARNVCGVLLIACGLVMSVPGIPGQGVLTVLAGVVLVDFPGRHRVARTIARWRGVLPTLNRLRARLGRPPLHAPTDP